MSTQKTQTSTSQFDPTSMGVFQGFQPQFGSAISDEVKNPYSNMFFNTQLGMQNQANQQQFGSQQQSMLQRAQAMGMNPNSPAFMSMMSKLQRQNMANTSGGFNNLLLQAGQLRQQALGEMGSYRPLQTGQTQVQKQSGLGTWLPQVLSGGMGLASMFFGGGKSSSGGSSDGGGGGSFFGGESPNFANNTTGGPFAGSSSDFNPFMPH